MKISFCTESTHLGKIFKSHSSGDHKEDATSEVHVQFYLKDTKGRCLYLWIEEDQIEMGKNLREYKAAGIAFEVYVQ